MTDRDLPLTGVRVLEVGGADTDPVGRFLADLGADVLKVEPPGGSPARGEHPLLGGASIPFALHNANKRSAVLDPADAADRARFAELAAAADIVLDGGIDAYGPAGAELADRHPQLVVMTITDFGADGPRAGWRATDPVLFALSTALSRSGPTFGTPVLPPYGLASATAAAQAAWTVLAAYFHRVRTGAGDWIDFSRYDAVVLALDPPFGSQGQAAAGLKKSAELWRGRPRNQNVYPFYKCADGWVRICILAPRQWRGMFGWLGEPEQFADPMFDSIAARYAAGKELDALISALFADKTRAELVAEGQRRGVPTEAVQTPAEALASEHFREVGALAEVPIGDEPSVTVPTGPLVVNGRHVGLRTPAPAPGADAAEWPLPAFAAAGSRAASRPFEGMRIIDLGVIVAGGELSRLFGDLGAEIIKVESRAYPDGLRQAPPGQVMSRSWAVTHRNNRSLGLDLRNPRGAELFARLVADADAVFANFKPGTLDSLGFSFARLTELNPRIVLAESSAYGSGGPWSSRMGYGPLVRAGTGVSRLWTGSEPGFFDATTVFPDHLAARITAIGAVAALIGRERTGTGAHVHISQAEVALNALDVTYVAEAAGDRVQPDPAVHGVYRCAGDDEWCVISVRDDADRARLAGVLGVEALPADPDALRAAVAAWTGERDKLEIAEACQAAGIPAAPMHRAIDVQEDPQLRHRGVFTELAHPLFDEPMPAEASVSRFRRIPPAEQRPAPLAGEHTREVCEQVLGLDAGEIDRLLADEVLFTAEPPAGAENPK
ncbi:CoA transferase [uncultured Mycolicibacterium sp.]|uniref:CaiB/BaiF CoA-transferase family protein n=1 Tax=uncultured Mycolicibacterium sp. TaxID=2320817 RepID=UPI00262E7126|nr:CoA transferase [uncultured Mycolicibacterium sp.]